MPTWKRISPEHVAAFKRLRDQIDGAGPSRQDFEAFLEAAYAVIPLTFDWPHWQEANAYIDDVSRIQAAPFDHCLRLLLVFVRKDHFEPGTLVRMAEEKKLSALLTRLLELIEKLEIG